MSNTIKYAIVIGAAVLIVAVLLWRLVYLSKGAGRVRSALRDPNPKNRVAAINIIAERGVAEFSAELRPLLSTEVDPEVLDALMVAIIKNQWEPADSRRMVELRGWAIERENRLHSHARVATSGPLGLDQLIADVDESAAFDEVQALTVSDTSATPNDAPDVESITSIDQLTDDASNTPPAGALLLDGNDVMQADDAEEVADEDVVEQTTTAIGLVLASAQVEALAIEATARREALAVATAAKHEADDLTSAARTAAEHLATAAELAAEKLTEAAAEEAAERLAEASRIVDRIMAEAEADAERVRIETLLRARTITEGVLASANTESEEEQAAALEAARKIADEVRLEAEADAERVLQEALTRLKPITAEVLAEAEEEASAITDAARQASSGLVEAARVECARIMEEADTERQLLLTSAQGQVASVNAEAQIERHRILEATYAECISLLEVLTEGNENVLTEARELIRRWKESANLAEEPIDPELVRQLDDEAWHELLEAFDVAPIAPDVVSDEEPEHLVVIVRSSKDRAKEEAKAKKKAKKKAKAKLKRAKKKAKAKAKKAASKEAAKIKALAEAADAEAAAALAFVELGEASEGAVLTVNTADTLGHHVLDATPVAESHGAEERYSPSGF